MLGKFSRQKRHRCEKSYIYISQQTGALNWDKGKKLDQRVFLSLSSAGEDRLLKSIHSLRGLLFSFKKILAPSSQRRAFKQFITIFNIYRIIVAFLLKFDKLPTSKPGNHFLERIMREISKEMGLPFCPIWAPAQRGE